MESGVDAFDLVTFFKEVGKGVRDILRSKDRSHRGLKYSI